MQRDGRKGASQGFRGAAEASGGDLKMRVGRNGYDLAGFSEEAGGVSSCECLCEALWLQEPALG